MPVDVYVYSRIVLAFDQVPAVNLSRMGLDGIGPVTRRGVRNYVALRSSVQRKITANSVILAMQKAKSVRQGALAPVQRDLRRLQASRSPRQISSHAYSSRGLQENSASPRLGFQLQLPAAWRNLLDTSGDSRESEWKLVLLNLEIDASFIELNALQAIHRRTRRGRPVNSSVLGRSSFRGRKPAFEVPLGLVVANQDKAWPAKGQGPKFKMTAQQ